MTRLDLELELLSDAELGTGFATPLLAGVLPRDREGRPMLPSSHLKGLLLDRLSEILDLVNPDDDVSEPWHRTLLARLLGTPGSDGSGGTPATVRIGDLTLKKATRPPVSTITRTAVSALGTADGGSLRTVEAIDAGTTLTGSIQLDAEPDSPEDLALRLGLMAIEAVGAGRTRGAGRCRLEVTGERRRPSELLDALDAKIGASPPQPYVEPSAARGRSLEAGSAVWFELTFEAEHPVCCPETPTVLSNVIRSGPVIPASAVQGALLARLDALDPALATACLECADFRAWPLCPTGEVGDDVDGLLSIRVDIAHRYDKHGGGEEQEFWDAAIAPYHWSEVPEGTTLKTSDGFLLVRAGEPTRLWKADDLPRQFQAHGVHRGAGDRRNLFTVEALAPLVFTGLVALPAEAADVLIPAIDRDPRVALGKARGIRGGGRLSAKPIGDVATRLVDPRDDEPWRGRVFIVQSPLLIPDDAAVGRAEKALAALARPWGEALLDDATDRGTITRTQAHCGVRFGWNRHGLGATVGEQRRLAARRVVQPGSVLVLRDRLDDVERRLLEGLGGGRERGFGALLPHPGKARAMHDPAAGPSDGLPTLFGTDLAGRLAKELREASGGAGPTPSQIAALTRRVESSVADATAYLDKQRDRPNRIWRAWRGVLAPLIDALKDVEGGRRPREEVLRALRVWQDMTVADRARGDSDTNDYGGRA